LITPFIDPLTREKLKFNDDMRQHVPPQQLWSEFQGDLEFEYDHATYWPALLKLCEEKQKEQKERWIRAGRNYGESEFYLKGREVESTRVATSEHLPAYSEAIAEELKENLQANSKSDTMAQYPVSSNS
jgi:hypothetical protein